MSVGPPLHLGGTTVGQPLQGGGVRVGGPVVVGAGAARPALDDLVDVDAPPEQVGLLERQADRTVRPVTRAEILAPHIGAAEPHPAYDDLPSLVLLFENRLV